MSKDNGPKFPTPHVRQTKPPTRPPNAQELEMIIAQIIHRLHALTGESLLMIALVPTSNGTEIVTGGMTRTPEEAKNMLQKALEEVPGAVESRIIKA